MRALDVFTKDSMEEFMENISLIIRMEKRKLKEILITTTEPENGLYGILQGE